MPTPSWRAAAARVELPGILLLALIAVALVHPVGDFPLNDDENCAIATWNFAHTLHFIFPIDTTPPLRAQVVWGAAWTLIFGESFEVLRASTIVLALMTLIVVNRTLALAGLGALPRILSTLALLFNPLFFWATNTFMTEVPYVFASAVSLCCFYRSLRNSSWGWFIGGLCAVAVSWWIRQGIVNVVPPLVLLAVYRGRLTSRWKPMLAATLALLTAYAAMSYLRPDLMVASPAEFRLHYKVWLEPTFRVPEIVTMLFSYLFFNVQHSALFFLPLALAVVLAMPAIAVRWQRVLLIAASVLMLGRMTQMIVRRTMLPYVGKNLCCEVSYGNIFTNIGLGPLTLPDTWNSVHEYPWHLDAAGRMTLSYAATIIAVLTLTALVIRIAGMVHKPHDNLLALLAAVSIAAGTATLAVSSQYVDRYALDTAWGCVFLLPLAVRWELARVRIAAAVVLLVFAAFSIFALQEYFSWNRARWDAYWGLRNAGVPLRHIDGGAEPYLYFEMSKARTPQERRKMAFTGGGREYMLAFAPVPGFRVVARHPFKGWLGMHRGTVVTLRRISGTSG